MPTIPASQLVSVTPSVLAAGGQAIDVNGLILTTNTRVPIGTVAIFTSALAVSNYFGAASQEAALAAVYFSGFVGADVAPGALLFAQYNSAPVSAFLRGGSLATMTLAQLQAVNATLSVTIDGVVKSATINLAAATSFSNAAEIIGFDLGIEGVQAGIGTGSIATTTLTITAMTSGTFGPGDVISGTGVTLNTFILAQLTSTEPGGALGLRGTYSVSVSQSVASTTITAFTPGVTFDSVTSAFNVVSGTTGASSTITFGSGAAATTLALTQATGAVLSQGAIAAVPASFMNTLVTANSDWVTFMTAFDPDGGSGNTVKQAFAAWKNTQNQDFAYICWDTDASPRTTVPAAASLGQILAANNDTGTCLISALDAVTGPQLAAFVCGTAAAIDFNETNGRITFAYKSQAGIVASITDGLTASNLIANHYNFYGAYGTANSVFVWFQTGVVTGPFKWLDSYIDQVWLNNNLQADLLQLLQNAKSIPYSTAGNSQIEQALADTINAGLNFGAFGPGTISAAEINAINSASGSNIAATVQSQGYYLQVLPASSTVRAARQSPPCTFWYLDRGSVQQINLASIEVQ